MRKKNLFISLIILVMVIACTNNDRKEDSDISKAESASLSTTENLSLTRNDEALIPENLDSVEILGPAHDIDIQKAKRMIKKYFNSIRYIRHRRNQSVDYNDDTKWVWFDSALVSKLYHAMKRDNNDGVRLYFGVYDDAKDPYLLFKTVIITTTKKDSIMQRGVKKYIHKDDTVSFKNNKFFDWTRALPPQNQGGLCPPPNDSCDAYGALLLDN